MVDNCPNNGFMPYRNVTETNANIHNVPLVSVVGLQMINSNDTDIIDVCSFDNNSFNFTNATHVADDAIINSNEKSFLEIGKSGNREKFFNNGTVSNMYNTDKVSQSVMLNSLKLVQDPHSYLPFMNKKSTSKKRKRDFPLTNGYNLYCLHCNKVEAKISGIDKKNCEVCNNRFLFECTKCCKRYNSIYGIYNHLKRKCTMEPDFRNLFYDYKLTNEKYHAVNLEETRIKTLKTFSCDICFVRFCNKDILKSHMQNEHQISAFGDKKSKSMNDLKQNLHENSYKVENRKKDVEMYCSICDITFEANNILCRRENCGRCNTLLSYQCKICKKRYAGQSSIYNHLKYECNNKPQYKCPYCDHSAKQKGNLQRHIEIKHSLRKCTGCGEIFDNYCKFRNHQIKQCINEAFFKCNYCPFRTVFKTQMKNHVRFEHKSKYVCWRCGKKYKNLECLNKHQKDVCGSETIFECNHCSYSTHTKGYLKKHIKNNHPELSLFKDIIN